LIGHNVLTYRFIVPHDQEIYVGEVVTVKDPVKELRFYAKVTDLTHESNFADPSWDTRPYTTQFYGLDEDVYLGVEAVPLGIVGKDGRFQKPRTLPVKFSQVTPPDHEDFLLFSSLMGDIEVGMMKSGQEVIREVLVKIPSQVLPQHMGVFATTGMGKSNFMKVFCASCMKERKFGLLIVDPHGEYLEGGGKSIVGKKTLGLSHFTSRTGGLSVFTSRGEDQRRQYSINRLWFSYDDFRMSDLSALYDLSAPQREVIEAIDEIPGSEVVQFFQDLDPEVFTSESYRHMTGKNREIAHRVRTSMPGPLRVLKRRIENLKKYASTFFRQSGSALSEIQRHLKENRVVLVDIPMMSERAELFVLSILTRTIMAHHQELAQEAFAAGGDGALPQVLIAIEEAQRVLGSFGSSTQVFRECAMEGRKFGVGLCVITQQPKNIDPRVLAQLNTFVVMGLSDKGDREMIAASAKHDLSRMDTEIQTLDRGDALVSTIGIPFPVSTRIHLYEDFLAHENRTVRDPAREGLVRGFT
jgi:hypothetical protein